MLKEGWGLCKGMFLIVKDTNPKCNLLCFNVIETVFNNLLSRKRKKKMTLFSAFISFHVVNIHSVVGVKLPKVRSTDQTKGSTAENL